MVFISFARVFLESAKREPVPPFEWDCPFVLSGWLGLHENNSVSHSNEQGCHNVGVLLTLDIRRAGTHMLLGLAPSSVASNAGLAQLPAKENARGAR